MSETYYIKSGNTFSVTDSQNIDIYKRLPASTYVVLYHPEKGFYLSLVDKMPVPKKIYGHTEAQVERIYNTFSKRSRNTGVLLNGEKGAGKTLTLSLLAHEFMKNDLPAIIINSNFSGDAFNKFISEISQPCMIAFDEFDKTYDNEDQAKILTLLDGVFNSQKLFVLTCNDSWKVNTFMKNRPGRIYYNISYSRIEEDAIREYCEDVLTNKSHIEGVVTIANTVDAFNFDMLKALIEEMNRYNEPAKDAVKMMNIRPERSDRVKYKYVVTKDGAVVGKDDLHSALDPITSKEFKVQYEFPNPDYEAHPEYEDKMNYDYITLNGNHMTKLDATGYTFEKDGFVVTIIKEVAQSFSYSEAYF